MIENDSAPSTANLSADLLRLIHGYQFTQALCVAAQLGIPDLLTDGPRSVGELAASSNCHAPSLARLLRALSTLGVFTEVGPDVFGLTAMGELLRSDRPGPHRAGILLARSQYHQWGDLLHSVQAGETTVQHLYGMSLWEWLAQNPDRNVIFNDAMVEGATRRVSAALEVYDFSRFATVVDVGGGRGALLARILQCCPGTRGVLFDQPHVIEAAGDVFASAGVTDRVSIIAGDFFTNVPEAGDAYVLSAIVHDWDDEPATAILNNCRRAMGEGGTLLLIDRVLPADAGRDWEPYFMDLNMMQALGSRERTEAEWHRLLNAAQFRLTRIVSTGAATSIIEAHPAPIGRAESPAGSGIYRTGAR